MGGEEEEVEGEEGDVGRGGLTHSELLHVTCDLFPDLAVIL